MVTARVKQSARRYYFPCPPSSLQPTYPFYLQFRLKICSCRVRGPILPAAPSSSADICAAVEQGPPPTARRMRPACIACAARGVVALTALEISDTVVRTLPT